MKAGTSWVWTNFAGGNMKKSLFAAIVIFGVSFSLAADDISQPSLGDSSSPAITAKTKQTEIAEASSRFIQRFQSALKGELMAGMKAGGPVGALDICKMEAPKIAAAHAHSGWSIKRVSDRNRNPQNLPDSIEADILDRFIEGKATPAAFGRWVRPDSLYQYYAPIVTGKLCLNCHGDAASLASGVPEKLKELYPDDRAVGYKEGDIRGLFVVEVKWPDGREYMEQLLADSTLAE